MGSKLLAEIGQAIKDKCRMIDLAFRYGGDEFGDSCCRADFQGKTREALGGGATACTSWIRETVWLE